MTPAENAKPIAVAVPENAASSGTKKVLYYNPARESTTGGSAAAKYSATGSALVDAPEGTRFQALPETEDEGRQILLVTGPSGSGKSYFMRDYAQAYSKLFPERHMFLISALGKDTTLDELGHKLRRIDLNKLAADVPDSVVPWKNSLVLIDDVEGLDPVKTAAVQRVQDLISSEGRHTNTTLLRASHLATDYKRTRLLLQEVHGFVLYPQSGAHSGYMYLLEKYGGFDKKEAKELLRTNARWIYVHHSFPKFMLTPTSCKLL